MNHFSLFSPINIVNSHHKVLSAWAAYRKVLGQTPRLITLDHHTDTSRPFRGYIAQEHGKYLAEEEFIRAQDLHLKAINFVDPKTVEDGIVKLCNDEHIVAAIKTNIISSAFVIAHNAVSTDLQTYEEHKIVCSPVTEIKSNDGSESPDYNQVLESSFLDQALSVFEGVLIQALEPRLFSEPYILDIDLDYFNTFKAVAPQDSVRFKALVRNAGSITIATEPEYVEKCAIDSGLTSEHLLEKVIELILDSE